MKVCVKTPFAHEGRIYMVGLYEVTPALAEDLDELERIGWLVVLADIDDDHAVHLDTPENGQRITVRQVPTSPVSSAGDSMVSIL